MSRHLEALRHEISSLDDWLKFFRWRRDMADSGFGPVTDELLAGKYEPDELGEVVSAQFYRKLFDHLAAQDRVLAEFDPDAHERIRQQFRRLDEWEVKAASARIRQFQLGRDDRPRGGWAAPATSELGILQRETPKKRRQMPLRKLFPEIPGVLQRLKPCIMMSPLSVSTFLQSDEIRFDVVIFDEASQVFPWDEAFDADLTPRQKALTMPSNQTFSKIEDVPDGHRRASALVVAIRAGATDLEDFIRIVARELGFARTGKKIRERLETVVNEEVHAGKLRRVGERIAPPSESA